MPGIHLTTFIAAPPARVFDLSRNTSVFKSFLDNRPEKHQISAAGVLAGQGDTITYQVKHAGKNRVVTLRLVEFNAPVFFVEEQVKGDLKSFRHEHHFKQVDNGTIMIDLVEYDYPRDMLGGMLGRWYMQGYLEKFIHTRNDMIRQYAESEKWRAVLS